MRNRERYNETKRRNNIILVLAILLVLLLTGFGTFWLLKNYKTEEAPTTTESLIGVEDTENATTKVAASTEKGTTEGKVTTKDKTTRATTEGGATTEGSTTTESRTTTETSTTEGTSPTERPTTTEAPTTERSTTERPTTTEAPTTERPTTERPTTETPTTEETTECKHDWVAQYETKTEKVEVESAWDEEITEDRAFCSYCGKDVTGDTDHIGYCGEYYYSDFFKDWIYAGASSIIKPTVVDVIHHPARYETKKTKVLIGYKCSKCGATK